MQTQDLNEIKETMKRLCDRLERIEAKVDSLAPMVDRLPWIERKVDLVSTKAERLAWIESKVDLLATKDDLKAVLISLEDKQLPPKSPLANDSHINSSFSFLEDSKKKAETGTNNTTKKESPFSSPFSDGSKVSPFSSPFGDGCKVSPFSSPFGDGGKASPFSSPFGDGSKASHFSSPFGNGGKVSPFSSPFGGSGGDDQTVIVKGFDSFLPEDVIKNALSQYFSSCGQIIRVDVPKDQVTGKVVGCAYIHLKEGIEKALKFNGSYLRGWKLVVEKASPISAFGGRFDPSGSRGQWPYAYRCNGLGQCSFC
ncbi:hypothetical protein AALP_AA2G161900 [Arabis alpina]|uniref:RRM domain-containing protein n=1 Tax=Arabis alpina TaxID=50452 RepID=A0A087HHV1_ARAAL|nr:hypothetical protein AALP_AA2G161900 [Arabis alpina]